jgi:hypothetical protein
MSDFERNGMAYDEPVKRRSPGNWFADLGDRLARGFNAYDRPPAEEPEWEPYEDADQPTAAVDAVPWETPRKRFVTVLHGYDRDAVDAEIAALEREIDDLRAQRLPAPSIEAEIERVGEETSAILRVAHEQATEITRRARVEAERCVSDAAANAVSMTEDAKRKLRQLDTETDAVWAERGRLIEDVRSVATSLFSLAEDAADRFPEDGDRSGGGATVAVAAPAPVGAPAPVIAPEPASASASANRPVAANRPVEANRPVAANARVAPSTPAGAMAQASASASASPAPAPDDEADSERRPD